MLWSPAQDKVYNVALAREYSFSGPHPEKVGHPWSTSTKIY